MGNSRLVKVLEVVVCDLVCCCHPDAVVRKYVIECLVEKPDPVRLTDDKGVERNATLRARLRCPLRRAHQTGPCRPAGSSRPRTCQALGLNHQSSVSRRSAPRYTERRRGRPAETFSGERLVVDVPVARVRETRLSYELHCIGSQACSGTKHSLQLSPCVTPEHGDIVLYEPALLRETHAKEVASVKQTMAHEGPIPIDHRLSDLGELVEHSEVQRGCRAYAMVVQHLSHTPEADAVAVVSPAISPDVRSGNTGPRNAIRVNRRLILIKLDVG